MSKFNVKTPIYMREIYGWLYDSPKWTKFFDSGKILTLLTLGNHRKLTEACLKELRMSEHVLQIGATFGNQIEQTAEKVGFYGKYDIIDVNKAQLERVEQKYRFIYPSMNLIHQDAARQPIEEKYDAVICYMLLHELPILTKTKVVNNALDAVKEGGSVIFIDYHNPVKWHPLRYVVRMINRLYQPFAEKLWDREIHTFAENKTDFIWRKSAYFGRMYQKVVATRKEPLRNHDTIKEEKTEE